MKRFLFIAVATLAGFTLAGCSYDDNAIWDAMDKLEEKIEQNTEDIATLSALIEASNQGKVITSTEYTAEGVVLHFSDGSSVTIKNGADGKDGENGKDGADGKDGEDGEDGADGKVDAHHGAGAGV